MMIRKAKKGDIPVLVRFMMDLQRVEHDFSKRVRCDKKTKDFFEKKLLSRRINNPDYLFYIAFEKNKPIGIISGWKEYISHVYKNEFVGCIPQLIVYPEYRGVGVGKRLVETVISEFLKMGIKEVKIEVYFKNSEGKRFWRKLGFEDLYIQMRKDIY